MRILRRTLAVPVFLLLVGSFVLGSLCGRLLRRIDRDAGRDADDAIAHGTLRACGEMALDLQRRIERLDRLRRQVEAYETKMGIRRPGTVDREDFLVALGGRVAKN
jgi:hypothetical protein